jgi:SAM-dependent methyltransferase
VARRSGTDSADGAWPDEVARYYDSNTRRFLLMGSRGVHSIHRELWADGIDSAAAAAGYIDGLIADEIEGRVRSPDPVLIDFGCGVGSTLFHLADRLPEASLVGITVSRRQVEIASGLAAERGVVDRCSFRHGDFESVDLGVQADVVFAIESFVHARSAGGFLDGAVRHLRIGGWLIIVDDFLSVAEASLAARQRRLVERFRSGWRVPSVCTLETLIEVAAERELETAETVDLTTLTRPGSRLRDRAVSLVAPILGGLGLERLPFFGNMVGGNALQVGLREGFLRYHLIVLRRTA